MWGLFLRKGKEEKGEEGRKREENGGRRGEEGGERERMRKE